MAEFPVRRINLVHVHRAHPLQKSLCIAGRFQTIMHHRLIPPRQHIKEQQRRKETAQISMQSTHSSHTRLFFNAVFTTCPPWLPSARAQKSSGPPSTSPSPPPD